MSKEPKKTPKKARTRPKVIRNGEPVDKNSTQIISDQREKLMASESVERHQVDEGDPIKLNSTKTEEIYTAGQSIECSNCSGISPSPRMYRYKSTSRGPATLCEGCDEDAEVRSFYKLDALDKYRKKPKVG